MSIKTKSSYKHNNYVITSFVDGKWKFLTINSICGIKGGIHYFSDEQKAKNRMVTAMTYPWVIYKSRKKQLLMKKFFKNCKIIKANTKVTTEVEFDV